MNSFINTQSRIITSLALLGLLILLPHPAQASLYQIDDGISEDSVGVTGTPNDFIALNQFNVFNGQDMIGAVEIAWGTPNFPDPSLNGLSYTVAIWADPNNDGNPSDAFLLGTAPGVISNANTDTFDITAFSSCIRVTTSFFVGFLISTDGSKFPAGFDESNPLSGRSFVTAASYQAGDLTNLTNNTLLPLDTVENYGLMGNFMIRADPWQVPEPTSMTLVVFAGVAGLLVYHRSSRRKGALQNSDSTRIAHHHRAI